MFHKALGQLCIRVLCKVETGAGVVFLNGKTENFPVSGKIVPLRITVGLQHPVETAVGEINIIHQSAVPVPEDHSVCLHGNLLAVIKLPKILRRALLLSMIFTSSTPRTVQLMSSPIPTEMPLVMQASQMGALEVGPGT